MFSREGKASVGGWIIAIVGIIILAIIGYFAVQSIGGTDAFSTELNNYQSVGQVTGHPWTNFLTYIIGGVPSKLVATLGDISSLIVIILIFVMLALTFGDILSKFGAYTEWVGWVLGILLAIVGVNLKMVMMIGILGFAFAGGVGAFAVVLSIIVPFILFAIAHFMVLNTVVDWLVNKRTDKQVKDSKRNILNTIKTFKEFGQELRKP